MEVRICNVREVQQMITKQIAYDKQFSNRSCPSALTIQDLTALEIRGFCMPWLSSFGSTTDVGAYPKCHIKLSEHDSQSQISVSLYHHCRYMKRSRKGCSTACRAESQPLSCAGLMFTYSLWGRCGLLPASVHSGGVLTRTFWKISKQHGDREGVKASSASTGSATPFVPPKGLAACVQGQLRCGEVM